MHENNRNSHPHRLKEEKIASKLCLAARTERLPAENFQTFNWEEYMRFCMLQENALATAKNKKLATEFLFNLFSEHSLTELKIE